MFDGVADIDEASKQEIKTLLLQYDRTLLVSDPRRCEPKKCAPPHPIITCIATSAVQILIAMDVYIHERSRLTKCARCCVLYVIYSSERWYRDATEAHVTA